MRLNYICYRRKISLLTNLLIYYLRIILKRLFVFFFVCFKECYNDDDWLKIDDELKLGSVPSQDD